MFGMFGIGDYVSIQSFIRETAVWKKKHKIPSHRYMVHLVQKQKQNIAQLPSFWRLPG